MDENNKDMSDVAPPLISKETNEANMAQVDSKPKSIMTSTRTQITGKIAPKKVITGENRREQQRLLKQRKDERKLLIDPRHTFIFQTIADASDLDLSQVEDALLGDEKWSAFDDFFEPNKSRKIMFYYQEVMVEDYSRYDSVSIGVVNPHKKLFIATGSSEPLKGLCFLFIRSTDKAITPSNIAAEITFQMLDASGGRLLDVLERHISKIIIPILKHLEEWGSMTTKDGHNAKISEFFDVLDRFISALANAQKNMDSQMQLDDDEDQDLMTKIEVSSYRNFALNSSETMEKLEHLLQRWIKQIEQVLSESEQIRREADDVGPSAELSYWKSRMSRFNNLLEQMKTKKVTDIITILHFAKSRSLRKWRELDARITDAANEAKDNVKYLYTLNKFFGPLSKCNPTEMVEHIPSLINAIRMIYSISQYYNSSERMTSLFVKVTNQMITTCKHYMYDGVSRIWEHSKEEIAKRIGHCKKLHEEYELYFHKTKKKLQEDPAEKQFEFSENYIFGKFDAFCKRLDKISHLQKLLESYSILQTFKIEGIDSIVVRYKAIHDIIKKKSYDVLDHRKSEFDNDYKDLIGQFESLENQILAFLEAWFQNVMPITKQINLLRKFEGIDCLKIDCNDKHAKILHNYSKILDNVRKLYQKYKLNPPLMRNLPPIAGKIYWSRHLFKIIEGPMILFKEVRPEILKSAEAVNLVKNYNKMAKVLMEFELIYHNNWYKTVENFKVGLGSSLLIKNTDSEKEGEKFLINFDSMVMELIQEAKHMQSLNLEIPEIASRLTFNENIIKDTYQGLKDILLEYAQLIESIPPVVSSMMKPHIHKIDEAFNPGLVYLTWTSIKIPEYINDVKEILSNFGLLVKKVMDILEVRIESILNDMALTNLCDLPEDEPITVAEFISVTEKTVKEASGNLAKKSKLVEIAVNEIIDILKTNLTEEEKKNLSAEEGYECLQSDHKKQRCLECQPCNYYGMLNNFTQRNTETLIKCTRLTLDSIRRRLQWSSSQFTMDPLTENRRPALFKAHLVLHIPNILAKPNLDEMQNTVNKAVQIILKMSENIEPWAHMHLHHKQELEKLAEENTDDNKITGSGSVKSLNKMISDQKDVSKTVVQLSGIMNTFKGQVQTLLVEFSSYSTLWKEEPQVKVKEFMETKPIISEINAEIKYFSDLEAEINNLPVSYKVGAVLLLTETLKQGLISECHSWKHAYALEINNKCAQEMDSIIEMFDSLNKRLSRPVKDLDDVRSHMSALNELREAEIQIDLTIRPIEETYAMLHKFDIYFNDGNSERVDSLIYEYSKLKTQSETVRDHLLEIQPQFKGNLIDGITVFKEQLTTFVGEYDIKGPNVMGIVPREASDRLTVFQTRFNDLWRKYVTYSSGEELFGLEVTDYPDLQRINKELNLLQKLYQLYNSVLDTVNGYYDISWTEINIDSINQQLLDFQNKCRKLPKALKEWQAFDDLRKTIDDFNETCPLLEQMANNAMMKRHWERIENVTNHKFDVESDNFLLRNLMEAPLLVNKEEIEDICISAVKEKDIEAKLKVVINDWSAQTFSFSSFKTRGELLLKGDSTGEIVSLMEDSLMALGALMSNRYNAPFKPKIQEWVQKLTGTTEIIENWLLVQNLWIYLEAVFVGGDIAKQLPQEAKRFVNIDKSWQKIMQRCHEMPNVVQCCVGDETLVQLLPHLLEQLEVCQKSLTGYLEKKRLIFPRFFFVSDPALLEILGQASDSHTIQPHLLSVFDNTKTVTFDEKIYDKILSINSQENETVHLDEPVNAQGNVEIWLGDLLRMSRKSLHSVIRSASITINDTPFNLFDFENSFPSQVGLLGIQMIWTRDAEDALTQAKSDKKIMQQTNQKFLDMLNDLISVTTQNLTKIERTKYETLITIHVHQRDIFDDLVILKIASPKDFEWLKQSRFYFNEDTDQCIVSITDVNFIYQNEFLGCTDRLVITPLTDRCYITLSQALGMSLGGAPAGPAGTGKTETTKDMGRCLGKFVVVFNCSDQMDYRGLGRIYKGLAQSGSWGCFDEFNRIELPVLSVAAQQISVVLTCKKERKPQFTFTDGDIVDMDPEFGIFLTMNPGYAGRQELPENLKINFRTVAMMVPDRAIIMRVKLASCGFLQNTILSKKFYTLYKLCEEQLSKQVHYDFGLRNILSVLRTLGAFKRENPDDSETLIVMRVLRDMNLSKLVDEDEALFLSLIEDLFPDLKVGIKTYPEIGAAIEKQIEQAKLISHDPWRLKLIQLYETQRVRHGMMTLGPSGAGKTKCINILMRAMTDCGEPHKEMRMNPKAITAPQMFGRLDVATNDWTDGIFSTLWRRTHKVKKGEHVWLILDGPVDAIWIENLNSVLDDNKTLTLANGDRIPMAPNTKIIFEVHNIDNASPATVSRNGMVYMSSSILDWQPILKSWLLILETTESISNAIFNTFNLIFTDAYRYVAQTLFPKIVTLECNYIRQAVDLLQGLIQGLDIKEIKTSHLENLIMFSIMWSLGALLELEDRLKLQELMISKKNLPLPKCSNDDTIFEYVVDDKGNWEHWSVRVPEYIYPTDHVPEYISILVPNVDNTRTDFLINCISKQNKAVLLIGEQGTAKTVIVKGYCGKYNPEEHVFKSLNFSSATTPNMFQRTLESYVDKRMGSTFGPPGGRKMTVFVDDINMPIINEWGDQITNEIVRQMMEMTGVYNLEKPGDFTTIVDIQFIAAMIHPGGGRNDIPQRLKRQFSIFNCTLPSNASIDKIFRILGCGYFCTERGFSNDVKQTVDNLVAATRKLWQKTKIKMLPTPAKFHYVFNLRDLSRIWQGMLIVDSNTITSGSKVMSLWKHECLRVITDRFTEQSDKDWFEKALKTTGDEECGSNISSGMEDEPYFVDFLRDAPEPTGEETDDADMEAPKIYEPIETYDQLNERLVQYMASYNENVRGGKLDLVFFKDAMTHLVKISRIIRTTKGHALLVGVGGSGKQSLTRLASFIANYETFQITLTRSYNITNLMEDLKSLYRTAGQMGKGITFLFTDNEIKDESFLEFLNNMLSSGEIANLFARDEMDEILQELINVMKKEFPRRPPTNENLQEYYMSRVLKYLHVVLCFSPVGEKFRNRSLRFPGLISGCTIDWFQRWPKDALIAVSNYFLSTFEIVCTQEVKKAVVNTMGTFQDLVSENCVNYFQRFRRLTHVTPKSYLSFISGYKEVYIKKKDEIGMLATRMNTGLKKLVEATESVAELSKELEVKEKELAVASKKAGEVLAQVEIKASAAQKVKEQVQVVKDRAEALVNSISRDKAIAEEKLEAAKPALKEAEEALETIKPQHIATVKKLGRPPHLIMRIMDCVLILFKKRLDSVTPDPERPCPKPNWEEAVKLMSGSNFLTSLLNFQKDTINDETVDLMEPYFNMEDFNFASAKNVSGDVAGLCSWTKAMASFFGINKEVLPLKTNLAVQQSKLESAMRELNNAQEILDAKQKELDIVQAEYNQAMDEKQALIDDAESCRRKMTNAKALIGGLAGERERWTEASKTFDKQIKQLVGDVLIVTAFLSYCGPFNQDFRNILQRNWKNELITHRIPFTNDMTAVTMLTDNATISEWNIQGLPNDELSTQNGLIVTRSPRYPLLIDPQGQGKSWIKNKEKNNELQITALNHKYFRNHLEDALSLGRPLLIEDVGEEIDPALDNVLEKNFIKSGRTLKVKVGDKEVDVMAGFQLYVTTKLPNPSYTPEIFAKTSIIDFTVTIKGLEDQLLGIVILTEKQELEAERTKLMEEVTENKRKTKELEDNLLYRLTSTEGSLVEDESLIEVLRVTKVTAEDVQQKLIIGRDTEIKINSAREEYRPVATRGSILYFLIVEMSMVNVMYQTSLKQFLGLFDKSMALSQKSPITAKRINNIIEYLTYEVFRYTARGFYESDKFTFTILLTMKIALKSGQIKHEEFQIFIKGGAALDLNAVEPKPKKWIQDLTWLNLVELSKLPYFAQITELVSKNDKGWKTWFDSDAPEEAHIPDGLDSLDTFKKLLLLRSWCPDRTVPMAKKYIEETMGIKFAEGIITNLEEMQEEGDKSTPMICFLSMGSDPTDNIERLAKKKNLKCGSISMGQGQEVHARKLLSISMQEGRWMLLQNCHLGLNFMDEFMEIMTTTENVHESFRCWITTEGHPKFPINLLQIGIKFTYDPPLGIRAGLRRTYALITQDQLDITNAYQWKPMLFCVAFLHTTVQERRKFGPIGWNIPYEFNQSDFTATVQFIQNHLDDMDLKRGVSWKTVCYMIGEVQYGGRVTDDYDKRLLNTYAKQWFSPEMFNPKFNFYKGYPIPSGKTLDDFKVFIDKLPLIDSPECFGLHANADIIYETNNANQMLTTIVNIQPKDSGGGSGETRESVVYKLADDMLQRLPEDYNPFEVKEKLKKMGNLAPLNIFLKQEVDRMQKVISIVRSTLVDLKLAIDGTIIMSENLKDALDNIFDARIPRFWMKLSWESATLGFWFTDLLDRNEQFHTWLFDGRPVCFWMTGFFNPQGFLTAMRQEITRNHKGWALDAVVLSNDVTKFMKEDLNHAPNEGVYIYGLYLDGAGWDPRNAKLREPHPKVLYTPLPVAHVYAVSIANPVVDKNKMSDRLYDCPVYKKPRRTDLNYIFPLSLKTAESPDHWILRGVALLCDIK